MSSDYLPNDKIINLTIFYANWSLLHIDNKRFINNYLSQLANHSLNTYKLF